MTTSVNGHIVSSETVTDCVCDETCVVLISALCLQSVSACPSSAWTSPSLCPLSDRQEDASVTLGGSDTLPLDTLPLDTLPLDTVPLDTLPLGLDVSCQH